MEILVGWLDGWLDWLVWMDGRKAGMDGWTDIPTMERRSHWHEKFLRENPSRNSYEKFGAEKIFKGLY